MTTTKTCGATFNGQDDATFACTLPAGHDGPVHRDDDGNAWGDQALPRPITTEDGTE